MGKKYIIELEDENYHQYSDSEPSDYLWRVKGFNALVFDEVGISKLTPYTEPDLEQVRKEAYKQGINDANYAIADDSYKKGLSDAWDTMRKIRGMTWNEQREVFGTDYFTDIIALPASECIEKIRQYEQKQEEQIRVGDEVKNTQTDARFIVTHMWVNNRGEKGVSGFNYECSAFSTALDLIRKTGRHFPEIAEVLQKMKETDNEPV